MKPLPRTVQWVGDLPGHVRLIDQTLLPTHVEYRDCRTVEDVWMFVEREHRLLALSHAKLDLGYPSAFPMLNQLDKDVGHRIDFSNRWPKMS